jgi:hypothetical protein
VLLTNEISRFSLSFCRQVFGRYTGALQYVAYCLTNAAQPSLLSFSSSTTPNRATIQLDSAPTQSKPWLVVVFKVPRYLQLCILHSAEACCGNPTPGTVGLLFMRQHQTNMYAQVLSCYSCNSNRSLWSLCDLLCLFCRYIFLSIFSPKIVVPCRGSGLTVASLFSLITLFILETPPEILISKRKSCVF